MSKVIPLDEERHCAKYLVMDDLSERDIRAVDGRVRRISLLLLRMEVQFVVLLSLLFCSSFGFHFSNKHLWTDVRQRVYVHRISLHLGMEAQHRMIIQWEGKWLCRQLS